MRSCQASFATIADSVVSRTDASKLAGESKFGSDSIDSTDTTMASMFKIGRQHSEATRDLGLRSCKPVIRD